MYLGAVIVFRLGDNRVAGQVVAIDHRDASVKLIGRTEVVVLGDWVNASMKGEILLLLQEKEALLFRKSIVRKEVVVGPITWLDRFLAWWNWSKYRKYKQKNRREYLSWSFDRKERRQLITGLCCIDGFILSYPRCGSPDFIYDEQYNALKKNHPEIWKKWNWHINLYMN